MWQNIQAFRLPQLYKFWGFPWFSFQLLLPDSQAGHLDRRCSTLQEWVLARIWECTSLYLGYRQENTPCSVSVVVMFLLGTHLPALDSLPTPFLANNVIKGRRERRAKLNLTRRSDCLVLSPSPWDKVWILAMHRPAQNPSCSSYCCGCHGQPKQYPPAPRPPAFYPLPALQCGQEEVRTAHWWEFRNCRSWTGP